MRQVRGVAVPGGVEPGEVGRCTDAVADEPGGHGREVDVRVIRAPRVAAMSAATARDTELGR